MKIRGKKEEEKEVEEVEEVKVDKKKKKSEVEGSRWAAFVLLIFTLLFGLWFYIQGTGGWKSLVSGIESVISGFGGESTYVIEN
jgi:hypothetical protein